MKKRLIAIIIALVVLGCSLCVYAEDINNLLNNQNKIQEEKTQADNQLEVVQSELTENQTQLEILNNKIAEYEVQIHQWDNEIEELEESINEIKDELNDATKNYDKQEKLLGQRLVTLYEAGDTSFLDFILTSSNIVDFISNYYLIAELTKYDSELLDNIEEQKNKIESNKEMLETKYNEYNRIKTNNEKKKIILYNTKILKESYSSKLSEEERELSAQIEEYRNQILAIETEIADITRKSTLNLKYVGGEMAWPVPGYTRITSPYGMRMHPIQGIYKMHTGVDIGAPMGADFIAVNDGIVTKADYNGAYGNMVIIDHGGGISTLYAHGSEIIAHVGQAVKKGDPVLKIGSTGLSTGPHAHFEVRVNGQTVNPITYITNSNTQIENNSED